MVRPNSVIPVARETRIVGAQPDALDADEQRRRQEREQRIEAKRTAIAANFELGRTLQLRYEAVQLLERDCSNHVDRLRRARRRRSPQSLECPRSLLWSRPHAIISTGQAAAIEASGFLTLVGRLRDSNR
jgi:hypothetical protein